jgi:hypothetical protein
MTYALKYLAIGFAIGGVLCGATAFFLTKEHYEKKFDEWRKDYIRYRVDLKVRGEERQEAQEEAATEQKTEPDTPATVPYEEPRTIADTVKSWEEQDEEEYESALDEYAGGEPVHDPDGDEDPPEEGNEELEVGKIHLSDDDIHDCLRLIEKEGYDVTDVADRYDISKQALQILMDDYKERCRRDRGGKAKFIMPYVITEEAYETEMMHHEKRELVYYRGDNVIEDADSLEQIIEVGRLLGKPSNLYRNKETPDHYIHIRNDVESVDFRIYCNDGNSEYYAEE